MGEFLGFFYIYVDESGKLSKANNPYTSLCGYVAHAAEWNRFGLEWDSCRFKWQAPPIHMAQIMSDSPRDARWKKKQAEWGDLWEDKRDRMLAELALTIARVGLLCVGTVVDADAYREIQKRPQHILHYEDSNVLAFHNIIMRGIENAEVVDPEPSISIIVDDDADTAIEYYSLLKTLRTHPAEEFTKVRKRIQGICFCRDQGYPGLQAADMIAWEARQFMASRKIDPTIEPSALYANLTHYGMYQPKLYTSDVLHQVAHGTYLEKREKRKNRKENAKNKAAEVRRSNEEGSPGV
jgi:hypothetical protein